ncbi:hypothetical protein Fmac_032909 [Flemingia macrophylla]|uniref:Uncharacterized protein n=1 Tax=Flemingia macrophylla TaxID=520843 RepID=A0ABD1L695_9FABA
MMWLRDASAETRKMEGKLHALVNFVTRLGCEAEACLCCKSLGHPVCGIRSSNDHHTIVCPSLQQSGVDELPRGYALQTPIAETTTTVETRHLIEKMPPNSSEFGARNDVIVIRGIHDVATDTSAETRKLEGKLDAFVNLVTQLAANQKPASVVRVYDIRSSIDHHTSVCPSSQQSEVDEHPEAYAFSARNDVIVIRGFRVYAKTKKLEGKLDALVNLVTQLTAIRSLPRLQESTASVLPMTTILVSVLLRSNLEWMSNLDTSDETRKLGGKLDALMNLVTQLTTNKKPASVASVCGICSSNDHHTSVCPTSQQSGVDEHPEFGARNEAIVIRGVHDVATDTSVETRKAGRQARCSCELGDSVAANRSTCTCCRSLRHPGVHDVATDASAEARKMEAKLDALVNLVTHLAVNQKPASVASVCGIRSSNDDHTSTTTATKTRHLIEKRLMLETPKADNRNSRDKALGREYGSQLLASSLEGKLDSLENFATQLATNQKSASVARVCGIHSSNDHHTSVCPSLHQSAAEEHLEAYAANTYNETTTAARDKAFDREDGTQLLAFGARNDAIVIRGVYDVAIDTSALKLEIRKAS